MRLRSEWVSGEYDDRMTKSVSESVVRVREWGESASESASDSVSESVSDSVSNSDSIVRVRVREWSKSEGKRVYLIRA